MLPRQSVLPTRSSHTASVANTAASIARLQEKKKEFEAVAALERATALFLKRMEGLNDDCEVMADAGQIHGQVLEQWPNMFRILGLFLANRDEGTEASKEHDERLVRIPLDELQPEQP
ncbi:hypothetical protein BV22DRAFT_1128588 [Leucogyrophana mollusca]|uniref:Uncharacterized protein n=1 Tax=Leucogyrophana mollusca TaxID=85980 RepID=A0ACB8BJ68_9AGAM|nr:hypothetical protein BV22DRAFT_1128588 [Leucogyrophana mollusca]